MTQFGSLLHDDDSLTVFDVRCSCPSGRHDEEETAGFEVVIPLSGGLFRRARGGASMVDATAGWLAQPDAPQEITHISDGDRCILLTPTPTQADELGLDAQAASWMVRMDGGSQRRLSRALATAASADRLSSGEAWIDFMARLSLLPPVPDGADRPAHRAAVERVREAIATDPGAAWTLRSLGAVGGYAPHHLSRVFRSSTGMTLSDYRDRVRLARAITLLRDGLLVADVATSLGYYDHGHLTRRAAQVLGVRPSELRAGDRAPMSKLSM